MSGYPRRRVANLAYQATVLTPDPRSWTALFHLRLRCHFGLRTGRRYCGWCCRCWFEGYQASSPNTCHPDPATSLAHHKPTNSAEHKPVLHRAGENWCRRGGRGCQAAGWHMGSHRCDTAAIRAFPLPLRSSTMVPGRGSPERGLAWRLRPRARPPAMWKVETEKVLAANLGGGAGAWRTATIRSAARRLDATPRHLVHQTVAAARGPARPRLMVWRGAADLDPALALRPTGATAGTHLSVFAEARCAHRPFTKADPPWFWLSGLRTALRQHSTEPVCWTPRPPWRWSGGTMRETGGRDLAWGRCRRRDTAGTADRPPRCPLAHRAATRHRRHRQGCRRDRAPKIAPNAYTAGADERGGSRVHPDLSPGEGSPNTAASEEVVHPVAAYRGAGRAPVNDAAVPWAGVTAGRDTWRVEARPVIFDGVDLTGTVG